ncbi:uncharacterized protein K02A2.6-like [Alosa sapidissima]|uniref:uncharacterized protein K02A2.6-like n=1 Tax=Alosa sapidissima TaxID=34773 RepID=UPI001C09F2AC|nr:uncharacterized protein K02A2.6-like [Alosa sapidissima]
MARDSEKWAAECQQCVLGHAGPGVKAPLHPVIHGGSSHQTAQTTVKALWRHVIQLFGCPERILTDRGGAFESELVKELCQMYGCTKSRTTPYHPQGNGACERFNQTLLGLLNTLDQVGQAHWVDRLPYLLQAYNNTPHSSTGLAPFYVLYGRHARLPVDMAQGIVPSQLQGSVDSWVVHHQKQLVAAYQQVHWHAQRWQDWDQRRYNQRAGPSSSAWRTGALQEL